MVEPLRHRQTKGAETDMFDLKKPRHISTLPEPDLMQCRPMDDTYMASLDLPPRTWSLPRIFRHPEGAAVSHNACRRLRRVCAASPCDLASSGTIA
jgi:hypothetical protein